MSPMSVAIDFELPHAATLNQLSAPTLDGKPDENARENCVPTSIAEGLRMLTGRVFDPDELKDAVYGQGYVGVQAAAAYVHYCALQGVRLMPYNSTNQSDLVAMLRHEVYTGHPVVLTMPSEWGTAPANPLHPSGYTHVGLAVGIGGTTGHPDAAIRVMNPWGGFWQDELDGWWAQRLCYGQLWIMSKSVAPVVAAPAPKPVPQPVPVAPKPAPKPVPVVPAPTPAPTVKADPIIKPVSASPAPQQPTQPVSVPPAPAAPPVAPVSAPQRPSPDNNGRQSSMNPFVIFARAAANLTLTPGERAFLKLAKGVLFTAVVAALGVAMPLISSGSFTLNASTIQAIIGAGAVAGLMALEKLFSAKGDATAAPPPAA